MQNTYSKNDRLAALRLLLTQNEMSSQEEVIQALARQHIEVTQSTLSRDFKRLKVAKAANAEGKYYYVIQRNGIQEAAQSSTHFSKKRGDTKSANCIQGNIILWQYGCNTYQSRICQRHSEQHRFGWPEGCTWNNSGR